MSLLPLGYTVEDAKKLIPCGHTKIYQLIKDGSLDARKLGRKTIISAESLHALVSGLPDAKTSNKSS